MGTSEEGKALLNDERFKTVDSARFEKKFRKRPAKDATENTPLKSSKTSLTAKTKPNAKRKAKVT